MTLHLEDIQAYSGSFPADSMEVTRRAPSLVGDTSRRTVLKGGLAVGVGLGMTWLGLFPAARGARADGYDWWDTCPSYAADHNCNPGCGPSWVNPNACTPACWHKNSTADPNVWYYLRPNQCYGGWADGWTWRTGSQCGFCGGAPTEGFWCHDGYTWDNWGYWKSICRCTFCEYSP